MYSQDEVKRRREERRRKIRRKRIITGLITFLIFSVVIFAILSVTVLFPVKHVSVTGSKRYNANQIVSASGVTQDTNMILASAKRLGDKIRLKLPFVDSIKIKRDFPDRLIITVTDAKEYAAVKSGDSYYTISKKGYAINKYSEKPEGVFEIVCSVDDITLGTKIEVKDKKQSENLETVIKNLEAKSIPVDYVDVTNSVSIKAKICGRFLVNFGTNTNLDKKIAHLKGMVQKIDETKTGKINLSMWSSQKTEGSFVESEIN